MEADRDSTNGAGGEAANTCAGANAGAIPRGIEVLVKKASVDAEFRTILLDKRAEAAAEIQLQLTPAEATMLNSIPSQQLEAIIDSTKVRPENRQIFLGKMAKLMLAALGVAAVFVVTCPTLGHQIDRPPETSGVPFGRAVDQESERLGEPGGSGRDQPEPNEPDQAEERPAGGAASANEQMK
ncbi:MAG: hypothetical protein ACYTBJ_15155 [Planctomycetota bacterium]